ncbi:MAG: hypothetical protein ACC628_24335, partial [Pirellulaceae bacterium]
MRWDGWYKQWFIAFCGAVLVCLLSATASRANDQAVPPDLKPWLGARVWQRDTAGPVVALGAAGAFEETLILSDGSWRMGYASRKKPPFVNKYFAINTACCSGPDQTPPPNKQVLDVTLLKTQAGRGAFRVWQAEMRTRLRHMLGIPDDKLPLAIEFRGQVEHDDIIIEKWIYTSEPGSRIPA